MVDVNWKGKRDYTAKCNFYSKTLSYLLDCYTVHLYPLQFEVDLVENKHGLTLKFRVWQAKFTRLFMRELEKPQTKGGEMIIYDSHYLEPKPSNTLAHTMFSIHQNKWPAYLSCRFQCRRVQTKSVQWQFPPLISSPPPLANRWRCFLGQRFCWVGSSTLIYLGRGSPSSRTHLGKRRLFWISCFWGIVNCL